VNPPPRVVGGQLSALGGLWLVKRSACARAALPIDLRVGDTAGRASFSAMPSRPCKSKSTTSSPLRPRLRPAAAKADLNQAISALVRLLARQAAAESLSGEAPVRAPTSSDEEGAR
jgi:hypothetical protein